jgi:flavin reductase (DIM6/NTAB) family NADH-FMN oxidoreductase RutF
MKQKKDNRAEYTGRRAKKQSGREAGGESGQILVKSGKKSGKKPGQPGRDASGKKPEQPGRQASGSKQVWRGGNMLYPVPAVMVSCARKGERPDIITVAWAGTVCSNPPMVSISIRPQRYSHDIIEETGEFVINLVTEKLARACDWCGVRSGRDTAKFTAEAEVQRDEAAGVEKAREETAEMTAAGAKGVFEGAAGRDRKGKLEAAPEKLTAGKASCLEAAPIILESPVSLECRVKQKIALGSHDMFLAEVVCVDADEAFIDSRGRLDLDSAGLIAYSHGTYFGLGKKLGTFGYSVRRREG